MVVTNHSPHYTVLVSQNNQHLNHGRRGILRFLIPDKFFDIWDVTLALLELQVMLLRILLLYLYISKFRPRTDNKYYSV